MLSIEKLYIVIPSFNPDEKLIKLINQLISNGLNQILVVNDGSSKDTLHYFKEAQELGCCVITHAVNLGKGRGLKSAYNYLLNEFGEDVFAVFADSDGQHCVADILNVANKLLLNKDCLIMGCRQFDDKSIPLRSRFGNKVTCHVFNALCGVNVSDTQTGLRGLSGITMKKFLSTKGERFEFEMNMLIEAAQKDVSILEVPIKTIYIEENKTSHFNPLKDSFRIYSVFLKFLLSSTFSFVLDISIFSLLVFFLKGKSEQALILFIATFAARVCSSLINYTINKNNVFKNSNRGVSLLIRYYLLCIIQTLCSWGLVFIVSALFPFIFETVVKIVVDLILFIISFQIQREWVFKKNKV